MTAERAVRNSWVSLIGLPVAMLVSFLLGSPAGSLAGVGEGERAPW